MKILIEILIGFVILSAALLSKKNNNGKLELSSKSYRLAMAVLSVLFIFLLRNLHVYFCRFPVQFRL